MLTELQERCHSVYQLGIPAQLCYHQEPRTWICSSFSFTGLRVQQLLTTGFTFFIEGGITVYLGFVIREKQWIVPKLFEIRSIFKSPLKYCFVFLQFLKSLKYTPILKHGLLKGEELFCPLMKMAWGVEPRYSSCLLISSSMSFPYLVHPHVFCHSNISRMLPSTDDIFPGLRSEVRAQVMLTKDCQTGNTGSWWKLVSIQMNITVTWAGTPSHSKSNFKLFHFLHKPSCQRRGHKPFARGKSRELVLTNCFLCHSITV